MAIGMSQMTFPNAPGFVGGRMRHHKVILHGDFKECVDFAFGTHPPRHPDAIAAAIGRQCARPAWSLPIAAQKERHFAAADSGEPGGTVLIFCGAVGTVTHETAVIPGEGWLPSERLKPHEALRNVADIQNRRDFFDRHGLHVSGFDGGLMGDGIPDL